ncbi:MAG: hypothetical protein BWZ10_03358 [candidate division BRC1 bacterium ADurb.BinA364]|nr:MAG: hypothetical protein BWZ10_03358 [candidate division BRC1 bacterium ADurb.BinA364]
MTRVIAAPDGFGQRQSRANSLPQQAFMLLRSQTARHAQRPCRCPIPIRSHRSKPPWRICAPAALPRRWPSPKRCKPGSRATRRSLMCEPFALDRRSASAKRARCASGCADALPTGESKNWPPGWTSNKRRRRPGPARPLPSPLRCGSPPKPNRRRPNRRNRPSPKGRRAQNSFIDHSPPSPEQFAAAPQPPPRHIKKRSALSKSERETRCRRLHGNAKAHSVELFMAFPL